MTRTPLVVSLLLLTTAVHAQAVRPAPAPAVRATPPVYTPGYSPSTTAEPGHTPAGAGASHGALVPASQTLPRSPNKRLLPPTKEAGLWAADGDPRASDGFTHPLFGLFYPHPPGDVSGKIGEMMDKCAEGMMGAAQKAGVLAAIEALPTPVQRCMSARAFAHCADATYDPIGKAMMDDDWRHDPANEPTWEAASLLLQIGRNNVAHHCRRAGFTDDLWKVLENNARLLDAVTTRWRAEQRKAAPQPKN